MEHYIYSKWQQVSPNGAILIKPGATPLALGDINIAKGNAPGFLWVLIINTPYNL